MEDMVRVQLELPESKVKALEALMQVTGVSSKKT